MRPQGRLSYRFCTLVEGVAELSLVHDVELASGHDRKKLVGMAVQFAQDVAIPTFKVGLGFVVVDDRGRSRRHGRRVPLINLESADKCNNLYQHH